MRIETLAHAGEAAAADFADKSVLVIDVFRATSCIVTGLACGCTGFLPVLTLEEARAAAEIGDVLAGERKGKRPEGFHLGNSPLEYLTFPVSGRRIVLSTTNGTRAIHSALREARTVMAGALLNAASAAQALHDLGRDVCIICSGTNDRFSLEDGLCAGVIAEELLQLARNDLVLCDLTQTMRACWKQDGGRLAEVLAGSANGKRLMRNGFAQDLAFCGQLNLYRLVPVVQNGLLVPLSAAEKNRT